MKQMIQMGATEDGGPVMADVFYLVGTHGIPLEVVLELMKARGMLVSWPLYVEDAMKDGAKLNTVRARAFSAVREVYGPHYGAGFEKRWNEWFE